MVENREERFVFFSRYEVKAVDGGADSNSDSGSKTSNSTTSTDII